MVGIFWHFCLFLTDSVAVVDLIRNWAQSNCSCCSIIFDIVGVHALDRARHSDTSDIFVLDLSKDVPVFAVE